jgi:hypothetical protein
MGDSADLNTGKPSPIKQRASRALKFSQNFQCGKIVNGFVLFVKAPCLINIKLYSGSQQGLY